MLLLEADNKSKNLNFRRLYTCEKSNLPQKNWYNLLNPIYSNQKYVDKDYCICLLVR